MILIPCEEERMKHLLLCTHKPAMVITTTLTIILQATKLARGEGNWEVKRTSNVPNAKGESSEQDQAVATGSVGARSKVKGTKKLRKEKNKKVDNKSKQYRPTTEPQYDPSLSHTISTKHTSNNRD